MSVWQVQEAKQRFNELLRAAKSDDPQIVTRHGEEIAVVLDIAEFHRLRGDVADFKEFLTTGPDFDDLELTRSGEQPRGGDESGDRVREMHYEEPVKARQRETAGLTRSPRRRRASSPDRARRNGPTAAGRCPAWRPSRPRPAPPPAAPRRGTS